MAIPYNQIKAVHVFFQDCVIALEDVTAVSMNQQWRPAYIDYTFGGKTFMPMSEPTGRWDLTLTGVGSLEVALDGSVVNDDLKDVPTDELIAELGRRAITRRLESG